MRGLAALAAVSGASVLALWQPVPVVESVTRPAPPAPRTGAVPVPPQRDGDRVVEEHLSEDDPRWSCRTMGNGRCRPEPPAVLPSQAGPELDVSARAL